MAISLYRSTAYKTLRSNSSFIFDLFRFVFHMFLGSDTELLDKQNVYSITLSCD